PRAPGARPQVAATRSVLTDVLVPHPRIRRDPVAEHGDALGVGEIDHLDAVLAQPVVATLEVDRFAHHHGADPELLHQPAAIPARRERGDHDRVAVGTLAAGLAEGVGFAMDGRVAFLHAAVVAAAEQGAVFAEQRRADGNSAFGQAKAGFGNGGGEHGAVVGCGHGDRIAGAARHDSAESPWSRRATTVTGCPVGGCGRESARYARGSGMDRMRIALFALAGLLAGTAHGEVVQGGLELRWGDGAPAPGARLAPKFEATLALDGGGRIALDAAQARRGAGDLHALANRRVAVAFGRAKSGGARVIDAIVPVDDPAVSLAH